MKRNIIIFGLIIILAFFSGCTQYSEEKVSEMVSAKLRNIELGMMNDEVIDRIGLPDHIEFFSQKMDTKKVLLTYENEWYYPQDLPQKLVYNSQIWYYHYKVDTEEYPGFNLYFNPRMKLIGWSCEENVRPHELDNSSEPDNE